MLKMLVAFAFLWWFFAIGISFFFSLNNGEKLALYKMLRYATICALLTTAVLASFVFLF